MRSDALGDKIILMNEQKGSKCALQSGENKMNFKVVILLLNSIQIVCKIILLP